MKILVFASLMLLAVCAVQAQVLKPVKWSYAARKTSATEAVIFLKATIDPGWHVYSQHVGEGGPVKTTISFDLGAYALQGTAQEPKPITRMEKVFNMEVSYFEKEVIFQQKVKLTGKSPQVVKGTIEYMVCNDKQCLPPDEIPFSVSIK